MLGQRNLVCDSVVAMQNEFQPETESRDSNPSEISENHDITVIEQILNLQTEYRQRRLKLGQENSVLVTEKFLQMSSVNKSLCFVNTVAVLTTDPVLVHRQKCILCVRHRISLKYICPMLKEVKKQERDNRDDNHSEQVN